jgi:hypothetical protein
MLFDECHDGRFDNVECLLRTDLKSDDNFLAAFCGENSVEALVEASFSVGKSSMSIFSSPLV